MQEHTTRGLQARPDASERFDGGRTLPSQELQRLQRLANLGLLSASTIHELKNAMVGVRTFVHLLAERHPEDELTEVAKREIQRMETIVSQTLRYAAAGMSSASLINVNQALEFALRLIHPKLHGKAILVQTRFDAALHEVRAIEGKLHQVFVNLLLNAIEAMPHQGTLTLATQNVAAIEATHPNIRVTFHDDGPGFPAQDCDRIFEPFFTTKPEGTGLGLAITRDIVEEFGGSIRAESQPGKGTTFDIVLPACPAKSA
jgi:signal transduction histidine kinase